MDRAGIVATPLASASRELGLMAAEKRRAHVFIVAGLVLVLGLAYWLFVREPSPVAAENDFVEFLERRDWSSLFDMAPPSQMQASGISKRQFVRWMTKLTETLPDSTFADATFEEYIPSLDGNPKGEHYIILTLPNAKDSTGKPLQQIVSALRDRAGWHVPLNEMPLRFAQLRAHSKKEGLSLLAEAMAESRIEKYVVTVRGPVLWRERLVAYLNGAGTESSIYTPK